MDFNFYIIFIYLLTTEGVSCSLLSWCTISKGEHLKCNALADAIKTETRKAKYSKDDLQCIQRNNHDECMLLLEMDRADLVGLDPNEIFLAGRHHSLVPIMKEIYAYGKEMFYSVAVVRKGKLDHVKNLHQLKGTTACFPSVSSMGGWVIPISKLLHSNAMKIIDCNNIVKSASAFFKSGCAVDILTDKYNPLGDNDQNLCDACGSEMPGVHCTTQDTHAGYLGAFRCLINGGDIAFVKHTTVDRAFSLHMNHSYTKNDFELMCLDGSRVPLDGHERCHWGTVPSNAVMTSSAKTIENREMLQNFIKQILEWYGKNTTTKGPDDFNLFESFPKYGSAYDLLLSDDTKNLVEVPSTLQSFQDYLSHDVLMHINAIRACPVDKMTMCITSRAEEQKCIKMKVAIHAQLLKPKMECLLEASDFDCMLAIYDGVADTAVFEAGDIYSAGLNYELIPIMAERYNLETTHYYAVAVSKEDDSDTDVLYLRRRRTCHPSVMHGGGWVQPLAYLLNNNLIRSYDCNSVRAASEYFSKSCVPGALSRHYRHGTNRLNLCHLCHGNGQGYCARDHSEPFYGFTGAFRCLVEGGGDVAFVKHTTVQENTDGKRKAWWARNQLTADFQLLCRDGTRAPVTDYAACNLGKVRSNAIVTRGGSRRNQTEVDAYINLFLYAQQYYGRDSDDVWNFKLFYTDEPYADLIFQDATQQLIPLKTEEQHYHPYLGREFLNARYRVDCTAASGNCSPSVLLVCAGVLSYLFITVITPRTYR